MSFSAVKDQYYEKWVEELPDMSSAVLVITGTTSGTGYHCALAAVRRNVTSLFLLNRASERSKASLEKLQSEKANLKTSTEIFAIDCDLMDFESVEKAAQEVIEKAKAFGGVTHLANNAGIMAFPDTRTKQGYDVQMQVNYFSHYLLTKLLFPSLEESYKAGKEVRICQHSSGSRLGPPFDPKIFEKTAPGSMGGDSATARRTRYHYTKLANIAFGVKLHKELVKEGFDVTKMKSVVAEPGVASTGLFDSTASSSNGMVGRFILRTMLKVALFFRPMHGAGDGSLSLLQALFGSDVESGDFFCPSNGRIGPPGKAFSKGEKLESNKNDETTVLSEDTHNLLWTKSQEALGAFFPTKN